MGFLGKRNISGGVVLGSFGANYKTLTDPTAKPDNKNGNARPAIYISDTQFTLTRNYENRSGGTTQQDVSLQLSTGRYTETFSWEEHGHKDYVEKTGRCDIYSKGKPRK